MFHIQQQHAGGIGIIAAVYAGQAVADVILRQHDLFDLCKILRFIFLHPEDLRGSEAGKSNVPGPLAQFFLADRVVEVIDFSKSASIVPQDRGADHFVILIKDNQPVHLPGNGKAGNFTCVLTFEKLGNAFQTGFHPFFRRLFTPARMRKTERIFFCDRIQNFTFFINQQELGGRSPQIYTDK